MRKWLLALLIAVSLPATAGLFDKSPDKAAEEAARKSIEQRTTRGSRNDGGR